MKKLLFLCLILFACTKESQEPECWECTEMINGTIARTWKECDILEVTRQDGRRWINEAWNDNVLSVTLHRINCK